MKKFVYDFDYELAPFCHQSSGGHQEEHSASKISTLTRESGLEIWKLSIKMAVCACEGYRYVRSIMNSDGDSEDGLLSSSSRQEILLQDCSGCV